MTREELILLFKSYRSFEAQAQALIEKRDRLRAKLYSPGSDIRAAVTVQGGKSENRLEVLTEAVDAIERDIANSIYAFLKKQHEVEDYIALANDPRGQAVLRLYYVHRYPMWMVGRKLSYAERHCWRVHNNALDCIIERMSHHVTVLHDTIIV